MVEEVEVATPATDWKIYKLKVAGQIYNIPYNITNAEVKEMLAEDWRGSIVVLIEIHPSEDGLLEVIVPRVLVNPDKGCIDDEFIILIDGTVSKYEEVNNSACFHTISF